MVLILRWVQLDLLDPRDHLLHVARACPAHPVARSQNTDTDLFIFVLYLHEYLYIIAAAAGSATILTRSPLIPMSPLKPGKPSSP